MPASTTDTITNLQKKVIGPARLTLKDDVLAIKRSLKVIPGAPGMDDTYNSPKMPGVTAVGLSEGVDMVTETLVDSSVPVSATEVGVAVELTNKMLRTISKSTFMRDVGKAMGSAINVKQEQDYATLLDGYSNIIGLDGASATIGQLSAGLTQLSTNVEPINEVMMEGVSALMSPAGWNDVRAQLFPTGSGEAHAPDTAQFNSANTRTLARFHPSGEYFGTPISLSTNLVTSGANVRGSVHHRDAGLIYEFMPVSLDIDDSDKTLRSLELIMVMDYGFGEMNDGFGREWQYDNTDPTS